jgi:multiple sugar transport system substrate-binding protein
MKYLIGLLLVPTALVSAQNPQYAGLDKDLSGIMLRMATIGGGQYEAMYDSNGDVSAKLEWYGWYSYFQGAENCPNVAGKFGLARGFTGFDNKGARPTGWAGAHAFSIPKASKNSEAAAQLIKFLTSEAVAYDEAKLGFLPVRDDVWTRVIADAESSDVALDKVRLETARIQISEDFKTPPLIAEWIPFSNIFYPKLQAIILGDVSAQEGLDQAAEETRQLMSDAGYY